MSVVNVLCGAATDTSVRVVAKVTGSSTRLAVTTDPDSFAVAAYYGPVVPDAQGIARFQPTDLAPNTRYFYAIEDDSVLDTVFPGQFVTDPTPGTPASFTIGFATCWGTTPQYPDTTGLVLASNRLSNSPVLGMIRDKAVEEGWRRWINGGDMHYYDLGRTPGHGSIPSGAAGATAVQYRRAYDDVLLQTNQHNLYRSVPTVYTWDDHDFGPDNSDRTAPGRDAAVQVYQERWPHYPLGAAESSGGIYQSFVIGRVLFIVTDGRSNRDPNSTEQTPAKTMLGAEQVAWIEDTLATSDAEALVVVSGSQWEYQGASASDTWTNFSHERQKLVDIFKAPGGDPDRDWTHRMCLLQGDAHSAGIASGAANPWGNFPVFQFAAIDSTTSGAQSWKDILRVSARGLWGTLGVEDEGDRITITGTVYQETFIQGSYSFTIDLSDTPPEPPPEPEPAPPPVAVASIKRDVTWLAIDDPTGRVLADLPETTGETRRLMMNYTSVRLTHPLVQTGPGSVPIEILEGATEPQKTSIVQVVNGVPVWAGRVLIRAGGSEADLTLATASPEQYLLQRQVTTRRFIDVDRALVAQTLLSDAGSTLVGPGMGLEVDTTLTGDLISRDYLASDQTTVFAALRDLAAMSLEWTIDLDFADTSETVVRRIMRLAPRIGRQTAHRAMFESQSEADVRYTLTEDFTSTRYANHVVVYGDGEGEDMPRSAPAIDTAATSGGVPIVERTVHVRDVTDPAELDRIAVAELARLMHGAQLWELDALVDAYPRLGFDAGLGDQVSWRLKGPRHPYGVEGQGRLIGWAFDARGGRWAPQLLDPHEEAL